MVTKGSFVNKGGVRANTGGVYSSFQQDLGSIWFNRRKGRGGILMRGREGTPKNSPNAIDYRL
jgi:hypothetical protein